MERTLPGGVSDRIRARHDRHMVLPDSRPSIQAPRHGLVRSRGSAMGHASPTAGGKVNRAFGGRTQTVAKVVSSFPHRRVRCGNVIIGIAAGARRRQSLKSTGHVWRREFRVREFRPGSLLSVLFPVGAEQCFLAGPVLGNRYCEVGDVEEVAVVEVLADAVALPRPAAH